VLESPVDRGRARNDFQGYFKQAGWGNSGVLIRSCSNVYEIREDEEPRTVQGLSTGEIFIFL